MVQHDFGGLDTPRTNVGDATYLDRQPDFDMTQEPSFQSPAKDNNILQQLRNGRSGPVSLKTPRGARPLKDRRNQLPQGIGGAEFTPMLKSVTRNSARKYGKENRHSLTTPAALGKIVEDMDMTNVAVESSLYGPSRGSNSYLDATPMPHVADDSSISTPVVLPPRRGADKGPLNDGNQLSLREQENVIDKIEKENFGLKLKIHFLEEALRKAGPGFSEAALKENTELKVDKVTLQRDLAKYKKQLVNAEKDLETYSEQILSMQERAKKKYADESQKVEIERLKQDLEDKEADIEDLQQRLEKGEMDTDKLDRLQGEIGDLEAELRQKDNEINDREEEIEGLKDKLDETEDKWKSAEARIAELEDKAHASEELHEARDTIQDLEASLRRLEEQVDNMKDELQQAKSDKERAENDLDELQEEMSNKSVVTKGSSRQLEEKVIRLQDQLEKSHEKYNFLEQQTADKEKYTNELKTKAKQLLQQRDSWDTERQSLVNKLEQAENDLGARTDEKNLLQLRHDALGAESASLQKDVARLQKQIEQLEDNLDQEKAHSLQIEQDVRNQLKADIDRLNDEISNLQAEVREKDNLYDNDSEKWENEKHNLQSERDRAEERAAGLQKAIDKLREVEGSLSGKEAKLQQALNSETERHKGEEASLSRQIDNLKQDLEARQSILTELRTEVSTVRDQLRQSQLDYQGQLEKVEALEDEVEVLQSTLDEESEQASHSLAQAQQECDDLRQRLRVLQDDADNARATSSVSQQSNRQTSESLSRLQSQLADANAQLHRATKEKESLRDQLANFTSELHSLRASLAETKAEREEVEEELRRFRQQDGDTYRIDQERLDLRTAKIKLDSEARRLREENRSLETQRETIERSLEDEIERAAAAEERLNQEILSLQTKMRQSSGNGSQELKTAQRVIRDLERRVDEYEVQLAERSMYAGGANGEGNSEISLMRKDLSSARKKELELLQRETGHKDVVRALKRQIADLERKLHEAEMTQLIKSPNASGSNSASTRKQEISELRHQLTSTNKSLREMRQKLREAERRASGTTSDQQSVVQDLQAQLEELEDEKLVLEYAAAESQNAMAELKSHHEKAVRKLEHHIYKLQHSRSLRQNLAADDHTLEPNERHELRSMLRESQAEVEALEHDIRQQAATINSYETAQSGLRQKLDKARNERATYKSTALKLEKDCERLTESAQGAIAWIESHKSSSLGASTSSGSTLAAPTSAAYAAAKETAAAHRTSIRSASGNLVLDVVDQADHEAVIRAADEGAKRHEKELRGLAMQMQWMQARWEREAKLRGDAAFAKRFLELRLSVAEACNQADLRVLSQIHKQLGIKSPEQLLRSHKTHTSTSSTNQAPQSRAQRNLRIFANALRAVARMRINSREWSKQEKTRKKLASAWEETKRREPVRRWETHDDNDTQEDPHNESGNQQEQPPTKNRAQQIRGRRRKSGRTGGGEDACITLDL